MAVVRRKAKPGLPQCSQLVRKKLRRDSRALRRWDLDPRPILFAIPGLEEMPLLAIGRGEQDQPSTGDGKHGPSLRQSRELFGKVQDFMKHLDTQPQLDEDNRLSMTLENRSRVVALPGDPATIRG